MSVSDHNMDAEFVEEKKEWGDEEEPATEKKRLCKYVVTRRGCDKGDQCSFLHPVCAFYSSDQGCSAGSKCQFKHDRSGTPMAALKPCPNRDCKNVCLGKQCMECHSRMNRDRSPPRRRRTEDRDKDRNRDTWRSDRDKERRRSASPRKREDSSYRRSRRTTSPEHPYRPRVRVCPEPGCKNTCLGRRCRACHFSSTASTENKQEYRSDEGGHHEEK